MIKMIVTNTSKWRPLLYFENKSALKVFGIFKFLLFYSFLVNVKLFRAMRWDFDLLLAYLITSALCALLYSKTDRRVDIIKKDLKIWWSVNTNDNRTSWRELFTTEDSWQSITHPVRLQIRYWAAHDKEEAANRVQVTSQEYSARLENLLPDTQYFIEVGACNSAGCGPPSDTIETFTKKARESHVLFLDLSKTTTWFNHDGIHLKEISYPDTWAHFSMVSFIATQDFP